MAISGSRSSLLGGIFSLIFRLVSRLNISIFNSLTPELLIKLDISRSLLRKKIVFVHDLHIEASRN